jgi:hypothetical protein
MGSDSLGNVRCLVGPAEEWRPITRAVRIDADSHSLAQAKCGSEQTVSILSPHLVVG